MLFVGSACSVRSASRSCRPMVSFHSSQRVAFPEKGRTLFSNAKLLGEGSLTFFGPILDTAQLLVKALQGLIRAPQPPRKPEESSQFSEFFSLKLLAGPWPFQATLLPAKQKLFFSTSLDNASRLLLSSSKDSLASLTSGSSPRRRASSSALPHVQQVPACGVSLNNFFLFAVTETPAAASHPRGPHASPSTSRNCLLRHAFVGFHSLLSKARWILPRVALGQVGPHVLGLQPVG